MDQKSSSKKFIFKKIRQTIDYNFFGCTQSNSVLFRFEIYDSNYIYTFSFEKKSWCIFEKIVLEGTRLRVFPASDRKKWSKTSMDRFPQCRKLFTRKQKKSLSVSLCEFERLREDIDFSSIDRRDFRKNWHKFSNLFNPAEPLRVQTRSQCRQNRVKTRSLPLFLAEHWLLKVTCFSVLGSARTPAP